MEKPSNKSMKAAFRSSKEWITHRILMIKAANNRCQFCQLYKAKGLHVHHKDLNPANYTDLSDESHFAVLCTTCHDMVHFLERRVNNKKSPCTSPAIIAIVKRFFI